MVGVEWELCYPECGSYFIRGERIISEIINSGMELKVSAFTILYQRDYNNVEAETGANPAEWMGEYDKCNQNNGICKRIDVRIVCFVQYLLRIVWSGAVCARNDEQSNMKQC